MKLLIIDTETTGIDNSPDLIEVAAALYCSEHQAVIASVATLVTPEKVNGAYEINKISNELLADVPIGVGMQALSMLQAMAKSSDYIVAHNAAFDKRILDQYEPLKFEKPWLCTLRDFNFETKKKSLIDIALNFGVPIVSAHRAASDVELLCRVFTRCPNFKDLLARAIEPKKTVVAHVSYPKRELAAKAGFTWDGSKKIWLKRIPVNESVPVYPFEVSVLD